MDFRITENITTEQESQVHQLENDLAERERFEALAGTSGVGTYRRLMEKFTGSLPSWAERGRGGRPRKAKRATTTCTVCKAGA